MLPMSEYKNDMHVDQACSRERHVLAFNGAHQKYELYLEEEKKKEEIEVQI